MVDRPILVGAFTASTVELVSCVITMLVFELKPKAISAVVVVTTADA